ncbi:MAG: exodeoxyribonuclease VII small subunit [Candidatus Promineifilaceae bacterium]|nr:exodeoxyribonuclease VII small subunit [Candidatus Promineifilaceae bacterium]
MSEKSVEELGFEQALEELEQTVRELEAGDLSLEASLDLYRRGQALADRCQHILNEATLQVEQLTADGEIVELGGD